MQHSKISGPKSLNLVASMADQDNLNQRLYIICQEDNKLSVTSEKTGRERIKQAAKICKDEVTNRIKTLMGDDDEDNDNGMFVYHKTKK